MPRSSNDNLHVFLSETRILELNRKLAGDISRDYQDLLPAGEALILVVTLKGAIFFGADLARLLTVPVNIDFVRLSSYGAGTASSGTVRILKDVECQLQGRHVLVVDEIVDSGRTLRFLQERLRSSSPASLRSCALLSKPSRREVEVKVDYLGTDVDDKFLVGYGLDYAEKYRNLKDIYYIDNTEGK